MMRPRVNDVSISQAQGRVKAFLEGRPKNWSQIDNHFYTFTHMIEEMGELARHLIDVELKLSPDRTTVGSVQQKNLTGIRDDLGDLLYALLKLAIAYNIDLASSFETAMSNIEKRYGEPTHSRK